MINKKQMKILAIETSCDETAASVIEKTDDYDRVLSNVVSSQIEIHKKFGGVFPEHASRAHAEKIIPTVEQALACSKPDVIAVTTGPGLIGSLLVGVNFAKTYAYATGMPIIGINHWLGHVYSNWTFPYSSLSNPIFPSLILIVSGGHTGLVLMKSHSEIQTLGETLDDAAGEAFDKAAKTLHLGYPGGPAIAKAATECHSEHCEESPANAGSRTSREILHCVQDDKIKLPRPMLDRKDYNFSFSGLKTAVLYKVRELEKQGIATNYYQSLVAAEFQQAVIDILIGKTIQAAYEFSPKSVCLCGGVSANKELREQMAKAVSGLPSHPTFHIPPMELTTDNAAMIGIAAAYQIANGKPLTDYRHINYDANAKLA